MAGLIDFGITQPGSANAFAAGFNQAEQNRNALLQQQQQQQLNQQNLALRGQELQMNQAKLKQIDDDRAQLKTLQERLIAAGKDPDPTAIFTTMIQSGNPELIAKGLEGQKRLKDIQQFDSMMARMYPGLATGIPSTPIPATTNALVQPTPTAAPAAPVSGLATAPVAPMASTQPSPDQLRQQILLFSQSADPRAKAMAKMLEKQLEDATQRSSDMKEYNLAVQQGYKGTFMDYQKELGAARRSTTMVTMPPQEHEEQKARGGMLVKQYEKISDAASLAAKTLPAIEANLASLNKGLDTGFGTEAKAAGAKVLAALGVAGADKLASDTQTFQANAIQAVLQKQLEQKGPQTESDAQRIQQTGAQLGNTKAANEFILSTAKAQLNRDIEQRNFYNKWWKEHKTYDGAEDAWATGEGAKSLFDRPELKKFLRSESAANQIPGQRPVTTTAPVAIPQAAIAALKAGKGTDAQFDAIFGAGAAKRARGQ